MKALPRIQFGNPILRETAKQVPVKDITAAHIQQLIADMRHTLLQKKLGVGLAAPQVGEGLAIVVIAIRPLAHRHQVEPFDLVMINPEITDTFGKRKQQYEGCISGGPGKAALFAKVPRYTRVKVRYYDETGAEHHRVYEGLKAQIVQHEVDHLHGILFVDRVKDTTSYLTYAEYMKRARKVLARSQ